MEAQLAKVISLLPKDEDDFRRLAVMGYQYGELQKCIFYSVVMPTNLRQGHLEYAKTAMRDLLTQCVIFAARREWFISFDLLEDNLPTDVFELLATIGASYGRLQERILQHRSFEALQALRLLVAGCVVYCRRTNLSVEDLLEDGLRVMEIKMTRKSLVDYEECVRHFHE